MTWDRGPETAEHRRFSLATDIQVYFCDPQEPWQRGSNENTNGLLRQYFPEGMDLSGISQSKLNAIARRLNERPRQTLGFETPAERFGQYVASIGRIRNRLRTWRRRSAVMLIRHPSPAAIPPSRWSTLPGTNAATTG